MFRRIGLPICILLLPALGSPVSGAAPVAPTPSRSDERVLGCEWRTLFDHPTYERVLVATGPAPSDMELVARILEERARSLTGGRCQVELLDEARVRVVLGPLLPAVQLRPAELDATLGTPGTVTVMLADAGELTVGDDLPSGGAEPDGRGHDRDSQPGLTTGQIWVDALLWPDEDGTACFQVVVDESMSESIARRSSVVDDEPADVAIIVDGTVVIVAGLGPGVSGRFMELCGSSLETIVKQLMIYTSSDPLPVELRPEGTVGTPVSSQDGLSQG